MKDEKKDLDSGDIVMPEEKYMVITAPSSSVELTIYAKIWLDGKIVDVTRTMSFGEVRKAFAEAETGYIPEDAVFTLTEKGERMLHPTEGFLC